MFIEKVLKNNPTVIGGGIMVFLALAFVNFFFRVFISNEYTVWDSFLMLLTSLACFWAANKIPNKVRYGKSKGLDQNQDEAVKCYAARFIPEQGFAKARFKGYALTQEEQTETKSNLSNDAVGNGTKFCYATVRIEKTLCRRCFTDATGEVEEYYLIRKPPRSSRNVFEDHNF
jgi:hypothetical protein